jgi:hypothetical protein
MGKSNKSEKCTILFGSISGQIQVFTSDAVPEISHVKKANMHPVHPKCKLITHLTAPIQGLTSDGSKSSLTIDGSGSGLATLTAPLQF